MLSLVTVSPVITAFLSCCLLQNYQDEDKKSTINKKNNSHIKKPHLKMIPIKDDSQIVFISILGQLNRAL